MFPDDWDRYFSAFWNSAMAPSASPVYQIEVPKIS